MVKEQLARIFGPHLEKLRLTLARPDALIPLTILGALTGLIAGAVILALHAIVGWLQIVAMATQPNGFESLQPLTRLLLGCGGGLIIGLLLHQFKSDDRHVGVVHVMERLNYHQGNLPLRNAALQFVSVALCLVTGQSVGREGPAVHLGAASGSGLGRLLALPNNSLRVLAGAGTAGAIAASFNTPLAGVIFTMEVVMMEYTLASFTPVIIAAVSATAVTQVALGSDPAFSVPQLALGSLTELPFVVLIGAVGGCIAVAFIELVRRISGWVKDISIVVRATAAGTLCGLVAMVVPQVMGVGYHTVDGALLGNLGWGLMLAIALAKLVTTAGAIGLGLPGGLIGPTLVIGAVYGGALGIIGAQFSPADNVASPGYYAILGMGATMAATLQAPLAALTAIIELTYNPNIILPGMLVVITASLIAKELFGEDSVFLVLTRARGLEYRQSEFNKALGRIGIASVMDRSFTISPPILNHQEVPHLLAHKPRWLIVRDSNEDLMCVMPAADLAKHLENQPRDEQAEGIDLLEIPGERFNAGSLRLQANLLQGHQLLSDPKVEILVIEQPSGDSRRVYGVATVEAIERAYKL